MGDNVKSEVKAYILKEFLPGESEDALTDSTPLVTSGILDSLATLKLVSFLEEQYGISLEAHEVDADHLDTIDHVERLVSSKRASA